MKALVVEDEFRSRTLLQRIMSRYGDCDVAINGHEAIEAFVHAWKEEHPYDLICMDIMMPEMDGQQALKDIREIEKKAGIEQDHRVKIIMTTAYDIQEEKDEAFEWGCTDYLVKPIDKNKLLDLLKKYNFAE
ncbi:response regulator [Candidatus Magnetomonas plexicatena]|uniref:response regulator n=1 Tax=Candidatus Magnetomonas plexicatena TaxID=2552947 RepID=UPI0010FFE0C0|nr:response regulator [Nitrospirales bacterium LBB_01]